MLLDRCMGLAQILRLSSRLQLPALPERCLGNAIEARRESNIHTSTSTSHGERKDGDT